MRHSIADILLNLVSPSQSDYLKLLSTYIEYCNPAPLSDTMEKSITKKYNDLFAKGQVNKAIEFAKEFFTAAIEKNIYLRGILEALVKTNQLNTVQQLIDVMFADPAKYNGQIIRMAEDICSFSNDLTDDQQMESFDLLAAESAYKIAKHLLTDKANEDSIKKIKKCINWLERVYEKTEWANELRQQLSTDSTSKD